VRDQRDVVRLTELGKGLGVLFRHYPINSIERMIIARSSAFHRKPARQERSPLELDVCEGPAPGGSSWTSVHQHQAPSGSIVVFPYRSLHANRHHERVGIGGPSSLR